VDNICVLVRRNYDSNLSSKIIRNDIYG